MGILNEFRKWKHAGVDYKIDETKELNDWINEKRVNGYRIYHSPVMDSSDYGMHFRYWFEESSLATEFKLKFQCL